MVSVSRASGRVPAAAAPAEESEDSDCYDGTDGYSGYSCGGEEVAKDSGGGVGGGCWGLGRDCG